jgi:hypothetical protein
VAWEASGIKDNIVLTSKTLQEIYKVLWKMLISKL